ncbi:MAG: PHP domain-containing protein [Candidatus Solibacter usitatus]|nr:PHP domain-containing protein [Candidatus Solibacter usitatus]
MRCDLHVHTRHSGMCTVPVLNRICRESYNPPLAVYEILKRRGMDLVTVTDHDSIDAVEPLRSHPDFFLSEEVTCYTPSGTELHMAVYDIQERHHTELERRRFDLMSLIAYLNEQQLFFGINHVFSSLTGSRTHGDFALFNDHFPAFETLNGQMPAFCNQRAALLAERLGKPATGGSDAHTLAALGSTYTEVPGARTKSEFLDGLRRGQSRVHGESGEYWKLTRAVLSIGRALMRDKAWTVMLAPLLAAVPAITLATWLNDLAFGAKWSGRLGLQVPAPVRAPRWMGEPGGGEATP